MARIVIVCVVIALFACPAAAVRVRYANEIDEELREHLTGLLWREVFDGEDAMDPLTNPEVSEIEFASDGGFGFKAKFEVRPSYDLPDLDKLDLPEVSLNVSDPEIDGELLKVQEEQAVWEPADDDEVERIAHPSCPGGMGRGCSRRKSLPFSLNSTSSSARIPAPSSA